MNLKLAALIIGGVVAVAAPALAHHSFAVEYDPKKPVEGTGVISKVEWTNPHMRIYIDVKEPSGTVTTWNLELGAVNSVLRRGWKPARSEEHTSELQSRLHLVCRLLLEKKKKTKQNTISRHS